MSNTFDLSKPPVVGYVYYREDSASANDETMILCRECDEKFLVPLTRQRTAIRDKECYGGAVPHMFCDCCDRQVTGDDS